MRVYIGIDGGGSKTKFAAYDTNGILLAETVLPSCHVLQVAQLEIIKVLKQGVLNIKQAIHFNEDQDELFIGIGLAGYSNNQILRQTIEANCLEAFGKYSFVLYNDAQIALAGALKGENGILIISGTGSIAVSFFQNKYDRCGGWGSFLDDLGSGYWIATQGLQTFIKQADGRLDKTELYSYYMKNLNLNNPYDIIPYIHQTLNNDRKLIAQHASHVFALAANKEDFALEILDQAGEHLADLANTLHSKNPVLKKVSYFGGVFATEEAFLRPLRKYLASDINLQAPKETAEFGAYLLAKKAFN